MILRTCNIICMHYTTMRIFIKNSYISISNKDISIFTLNFSIIFCAITQKIYNQCYQNIS